MPFASFALRALRVTSRFVPFASLRAFVPFASLRAFVPFALRALRVTSRLRDPATPADCPIDRSGDCAQPSDRAAHE